MHQAFFSAPVKAETSAPQRQIDRTNHLHKNEDTHHGPTARAPRSRYAPGAPKPSQENIPKKPTSSTTKTTNVSLAVRSLTLCELLDRAEQENGVRRARPFQLPHLKHVPDLSLHKPKQVRAGGTESAHTPGKKWRGETGRFVEAQTQQTEIYCVTVEFAVVPIVVHGVHSTEPPTGLESVHALGRRVPRKVRCAKESNGAKPGSVGAQNEAQGCGQLGERPAIRVFSSFRLFVPPPRAGESLVGFFGVLHARAAKWRFAADLRTAAPTDWYTRMAQHCNWMACSSTADSRRDFAQLFLLSAFTARGFSHM